MKTFEVLVDDWKICNLLQESQTLDLVKGPRREIDLHDNGVLFWCDRFIKCLKELEYRWVYVFHLSTQFIVR